jgi:hypothetical protein
MNQCGSALNVYFDTQVEGKRNSKDGYSTIPYGTVIPAVYKCDPGFTLQGTNCIKSVPAQIAAPARCSW